MIANLGLNLTVVLVNFRDKTINHTVMNEGDCFEIISLNEFMYL